MTLSLNRFVIVGAALAIILAGCSSKPAVSSTPSANIMLTAGYYIEGTVTAVDVSYSTVGGTAQFPGAAVPLMQTDGSYGITLKGGAVPSILSLSAHATGSPGTVSCRIMINGENVARNTSTGANATASCTFEVPAALASTRGDGSQGTWPPIVLRSATGASSAAASPTPTPTASPTPTIDPAVAEWIAKVGGGYGPEDAKWACDTLAAPSYPLPWSAVGDDRLIWAGRLLCPQFKAQVERAALGFRDGGSIGDGTNNTVRPGTYVTEPGVTNCYWERVTGGGKTIANDFVTLAPKGVTVRIVKTDGGFTSNGCGPWAPA